MKHIKFEENILIDESYTGGVDGDSKKGKGIAKHFAESLREREHNSKWYHQLPPDPGAFEPASPDVVASLRSEALTALQHSTHEYNQKMSGKAGSEISWARTLLKRGAIADRVAAATLLVQDSPIHSEGVLRSLIANVKPAKKKDALVSIDALSELFVSELLVPGMKLRAFARQPLTGLERLCSGDRRRRQHVLAAWLFQDNLKLLYNEYVESLNTLAHDSVEANRAKAVSAIAYLLTRHPENEKILLQHLMNKLGDPSQAVASKVIYHLSQLVYNHPNMKSVLLTHMERVLFRSNISSRTQYYGLCFLNQLHLNKDDDTLAENLIRIYFSFFNANIKKGDIDSRMMAALLTGVKRAYPYANKDRIAADTNRHIRAVQRLVHVAAPNIAVHSLALLYHLCEPGTPLADRFYTALYSKLSDPRLFHERSTALLLNLVHRALGSDTDTSRLSGLLKRSLQLSLHLAPATAAALQILVSQVTKDSKKREALRLTMPPAVKEEDLLKEELKQKEELQQQEELKEEEIKEDETDGVKEDKKPPMDLLHGDKMDLLKEESDEEYFDVKEEDEGDVATTSGAGRRKGGGAVGAGWHHAGLGRGEERDDKMADDKMADAKLRKAIYTHKQNTEYSGICRDPRRSGAELVAATELLSLSRHVHPSVRLFANKLINGEIIHYSGDPLKDFSCIRFLERFSFKNPRRRPDEPETEDGLRTVRGSHPKFAIRKNYVAKGVRGMRVTSSAYLNESVSNIPPDELFLYQYLRQKRSREEEREKDEDSDADSVDSDEFNSFLDRVGGSRDDESEEELDWSAAVQGEAAAAGKQPTKRQHQQQHEWSDDEEDAPELSDDEQQESSDENEDEDEPSTKRGKKKDSSSLFASAEEFAELLEESGKDRDAGTSKAVDTRDRASRKQIAWETSRDKHKHKKRTGKHGESKHGPSKKRRIR